MRLRERPTRRFTYEFCLGLWAARSIGGPFEICTVLSVGRGCGGGDVPRRLGSFMNFVLIFGQLPPYISSARVKKLFPF